MDAHFYELAYCFDESVWALEKNSAISSRNYDQRILRDRNHYLDGDLKRLWTLWFLEGLIDPYTLALSPVRPQLVDVLAKVDTVVKNVFRNGDKQDLLWGELRESIAKAMTARVHSIIDLNARKSFKKKEKEDLLTMCPGDPRCWICGAKFDQDAIDKFTVPGSKILAPLTFIDILKPRGLHERHLGIEIDHAYPISKGGPHKIDNFKLACGWCNLTKSDYTSIYDVSGRPVRLVNGEVVKNTNFRSVPQNFWTVRALALTGKCEIDGCCVTNKTDELTIALIEESGAATPSNMRVVCSAHDPHSAYRYQNRADVELALGKG